MRITLRGFAAATVGLVSAVGLAGCSGNSTKPTVLPTLPKTTTASPTTSASTTSASIASPATSSGSSASPSTATTAPVATKSPVAPSQQSEQMMAAVRAYYASVNAALESADNLKTLSASFTASCQQCLNDVQGIRSLHDNRYRLKGGGYKLLSVKAVPTSPNSGGATVVYSVPASTEYDRAGKVVAHFAAHPKRSAILTLRRVEQRWLVNEYTVIGNVS
jgi:hypothetical protein